MYRERYGLSKAKVVGYGKGAKGAKGAQGAQGAQGAKADPALGDGSWVLPKALKNRAKHGRRRRRSAPGLTTCRVYGPPRNKERFALDNHFLKNLDPDLVEALEKNDKEKEEEEEETRVPEKELEALPELLVNEVKFHMLGKAGDGTCEPTKGNAKLHHTAKYACCLPKAKNPQPILRRGQEFKVTIFFKRPYNKEQDDLHLTVEADPDSPGKNLSVSFKLDEERKEKFKEGQHWAARILKVNTEKNGLKLAVYIPGNVAVGEWDFKVQTSLRGNVSSYVYVHPKPFVVLFNPWSKQDLVYFPDGPELLKEYVLNSKGSAYFGCSTYVRSKPWVYGQFDEGFVQTSLSLLRQAFGLKITPAMADPIKVSRALSRIINSCDDNGVLTGNWSGDYEGGTNPCAWISSADIIQQYASSGQPVKFGQCWVFSHVMTAVCRALGLPCRSVTNFASAHDTDNTCTVDSYYDEDMNELADMKTDSTWNFHVWNEVWMQRPDIEEHDLSGWHAVDATPQEESDGVYQCGPCPVKAVKDGLINYGHDTGFVFGEVNADVVHWTRQAGSGKFIPSITKKNQTGKRISTKPADGKPHIENLRPWTMDDPKLRHDLTLDYKYEEGSEKEREAVRRAVRKTAIGELMYTETAELDVCFETPEGTMGKDLTVVGVVKNLSQEVKEVDVKLKAGTNSYWNDASDEKPLCTEKFGVQKIAGGAEKQFKITVPYETYFGKVDDELTVHVFAVALDLKKKMPYSADEPFCLATPDIKVECPKATKSKETATLKVTFTNPLDAKLTSCSLTTKGDLWQVDNDKNMFESFFFSRFIHHRDLEPNEVVTMEFNMYWEAPEEEDDEDDDADDDAGDADDEDCPPEEEEEEEVTQLFELSSRQLPPMTGSATIKCVK